MIQYYPVHMANLPLLSALLLALCTLSLSADVFVSIDCGSSSTSYKDENGIAWTGDDKYIKTGESHSVQSSNSYSHVADTLRVFTNNRKNCYKIDTIKKGRVLVRATFYYGNYDGKSSPPSFDLLFDGYYWGSPNNISSPVPSLYEVIYDMRKDYINFCLVQRYPGQFPYISALEIRSLESTMYTNVNVNYPIFTKRRVAFGSNATIRFPEDPYDRIWRHDAFAAALGLINVTSDAHFSNGVSLKDKDKPPAAVLMSAATKATPNSSLDLFMSLPSVDSPVYINWYFSEVTRLKPNQTRSFFIEPFLDLISPPYEDYIGKYVSNFTASSNTTFSLVPSENSTLPPLINAMEVFVIGDNPLNNGTNMTDVKVLASLQEMFSVLEDWSGDPCLPYGYQWEWVKCNEDAVPRVTSLLLGGYGLSGLLPDLSTMIALQTIDVHNNSFMGNIPDSLGKLPNLKILNLENNKLNGTIPASLLEKEGLILRVDGNPGLCKLNTSCSIQAPTLKANSSMKNKKKILEKLFATIITCIILLQFR